MSPSRVGSRCHRSRMDPAGRHPRSNAFSEPGRESSKGYVPETTAPDAARRVTSADGYSRGELTRWTRVWIVLGREQWWVRSKVGRTTCVPCSTLP